MDEQLSGPTPNPEPNAGPQTLGHDPHPAGARRIKRRLMYSLVALYALSLGAGAVLVLKGGSGPEAGKKGGGEKGLLAMAEKDSVGWVPIHGVIMNSDSGKPWDHGAEQWARRIRALGEAPGVKAIVLDINSPGGSVGAVQEVYSAVLRVRKEKKIPVVALFDDVAASGGYYIAAACDKIVAHPGTLTGSIGVIFHTSNAEGLFNKIGYKADAIKSGKYKDIGSISRPMTAEEKKILQDLIMDSYGQFVSAVSQGRKIPEDEVRKLADGRIYSGSQALQDKLVDMLGDSEDAIDLAGKLGGIQGKPKLRRDGGNISDIFDMMDSAFSGGLMGRSGLVQKLQPAVHSGLEYRAEGL
jgi:protease-4